MVEKHWSIVLHGGAKEIPPHKVERNREGCRRALELGIEVLRGGGTALDAVEQTIRVLEDDPIFNAGYGSVLNSEGRVQMDAGIMDGRTLDIGAVAVLERIRNPIRVARRLLREEPVLLAAEGAFRFAQSSGIPVCGAEELISPERRQGSDETGLDTVGCVARDIHGNIVAATSTGGLPGKMPGRIGDSPLAGSGFYADDQTGGVSFSGEGERIIRMSLAASVMTSLQTQSAQGAIDAALTRIQRIGGQVGGIAIDRNGEIGWAHNTPHFAVAYATNKLPSLRVYLSKQEEIANDRD
ncbi:MAG TPA: isoaspartyl peptidase/L-asparaginase family protein [Steroidobacteraceae bacterium]|nr:isoaspartyl peptidase/L-asparaginase family protein [Steroidobacteraceae bacterium]